ncbi:CvpA family protein [Ligilactobacillus sp. Marseille-Q7487]|jgi:uncharacterized membrane protein required for colicin V production|uniref:CvpA family protein n=1 Tax=Ligilactobacillus sp. Marseille-Q7487 TaxID=3022128 RepID=UPI0015B4C621|nr:CvpA family protein [Ligilactobacillus sp. Marseille-Q7487]
MIVSLIIILIWLLAFRHGFKKGLINTLLSFTGYIVIFACALLFAMPLGDWLLELTNGLNQSLTSQWLYRLLAFWLLVFLGALLFRILKRFANKIFRLPLLAQLNALAGGILGFLIAYVVVFLGLLLLKDWPAITIQQSLNNVALVEWILNQTPIFSNELIQWWQQF